MDSNSIEIPQVIPENKNETEESVKNFKRPVIENKRKTFR